MSTTILRPAEWVLPGHPDKLADAIADTLVQAAFERQPEALCAIEVAVHRDQVYLTGRLACEGSAEIDIDALVRGVYESAGYGEEWRPRPKDVKVAGNLCIDVLAPGEDRIRHISDDQSIVIGYAIDLPGIGNIPPEQWVAREIARELFALVHSPLRLCPDGKVLIVMEERSECRRLKAVSCSLLARVSDIELQRAVVQAIDVVSRRLVTLLPDFDAAMPKDVTVNGSGTFAVGGPEGDNGLSGKKLLLDHYGPRVAIGGTALSGKDFWKPDRAGTLLARRLALAVVTAGNAIEATVQFISFPGDERPRLVRITTPEGELRGPQRWLELLDCRFAVAGAWCRRLSLAPSARWGWFDGEAPWETLSLS